MEKKYYIMTTPCAGKTTLYRMLGCRYKWYKLYDKDSFFTKFPEKKLKIKEKAIILGGVAPMVEGIEYLAMIPSKEILQRNALARNTGVLLRPIELYWADIRNIIENEHSWLKALEHFVDVNKLKKFHSFEEVFRYIDKNDRLQEVSGW